MLRKQARKARADHAVKCSMVPGKKILKRKPLTELYVNGKFTEDREECDEAHMDPEETQAQEERIESFKRKGDQQ